MNDASFTGAEPNQGQALPFWWYRHKKTPAGWGFLSGI
jgi:hypothetical protein